MVAAATTRVAPATGDSPALVDAQDVIGFREETCEDRARLLSSILDLSLAVMCQVDRVLPVGRDVADVGRHCARLVRFSALSHPTGRISTLLAKFRIAGRTPRQDIEMPMRLVKGVRAGAERRMEVAAASSARRGFK